MKINKPKFWQEKNNLISFLLLPFSFVLQFLIALKNKITYSHSFKTPIICVYWLLLSQYLNFLFASYFSQTRFIYINLIYVIDLNFIIEPDS